MNKAFTRESDRDDEDDLVDDGPALPPGATRASATPVRRAMVEVVLTLSGRDVPSRA